MNEWMNVGLTKGQATIAGFIFKYFQRQDISLFFLYCHYNSGFIQIWINK